MRMNVGMNWLSMEGMGPVAWTRGNRPIDVPLVRRRAEQRPTDGIRSIEQTEYSNPILKGDRPAIFYREKDRTLS